MTDLPLGILFGVIGAAFAGVFVLVAKRQMQQMNASWQVAAETLGFSFEPGSMRSGPTISGTLEDRPAGVHSYTKNSGKSSNRYTRYTVEFPAIGVGLHLSRQAGIGQLLKILGTQDIIIGDPTFDEAFIVKSADPQAVRALLTTGRTMALNQLLAVHPEVVVSDDRIVIDRHGSVRDADVIISTLRRIGSVANLLADAGTSAELTTLVEQRLDGTLPNDYEPDSELSHGIDGRLLTGEALAAAGVIDVAKKVFDALAVELPADPTVTGWSEQVERSTRRPPPAVEPPEPTVVELPPDMTKPIEEPPSDGPTESIQDERSNDAIDVAVDLFGENRLSFETAARFEEAYAGTPIRWSGKVRKSSHVDRDRVLGSGPFLKTVVEIASLENDLFGNTVVSAIVAFPPERVLSPGRQITFTGKLVAIDALVRNLYVSEADLE